MKEIKKQIEKLQALPNWKKMILYAGAISLMGLSIQISGMTGPKGIRASFADAVFYCMFSSKGFTTALLIFTLFIAVILLMLSKKGMINVVLNEDDKGVKFLKDGTYGSGNWMTEEEAAEAFTVGDISKVKEQVYGQFTTGGKKVVAFKANKSGGNQNTFMLGSPGTGKSYGFARTAIIQAILRGESVVITDPSSELYTDLAAFAENRGANVKVLNFVQPEYSNAWDCLYECVNPETERLDALRLQEFCDIFMRNTNEGGVSATVKEDFWYTSSLNLLQAVIGYVAYQHEKDLIYGYKHLITKVCKLICMGNETIVEYIENVNASNANIAVLKSKFKKIAKEVGYTDAEIKTLMDDCESHASPFNIGEVYRYILDFGNVHIQKEKFSDLPFGHPGAIAFITFNREEVSDGVKASAQQGILLRLKLFMDPGIRRITSNKDIVVEEFGRRQTVCFLITPDNTAAMKPLQALFFSFLFKDIAEAYDKRQAECEQAGIKNERLPVNIIMDEAFSNGYISNFGEALSTTRKRKIYVTMIWQTIGQIKEMYGDNIADTLKSCCDILVFLGTADLQTAQYVSSFSGTATVRSRTHKELSTGIWNPAGNIMEISASEDSKPVMTVDDAMALNDEVVVIRRGYQHVLKLKKFGFTEHPVYRLGQLKKSSITAIKKSSEVYTAVDSINNDVSLKEITSGRYNDARDKTMTRFIGKSVSLPENKAFISYIGEIKDENDKNENENSIEEQNKIFEEVKKTNVNPPEIISSESMFIRNKRKK